MEITRATAADLTEAHGLVRAAVAHMDAQGIPQWDEIYPDRAVLAADIAEGTLFTARRDGRLAGIIVLNECQDPEYAELAWAHAGPVLVVHRLTVHPEARRRGVAARLMDFAEAEAAARGYAAIRLDAFTLNPAACALYRRRGYRHAGTIRLRKGPFHCFERAVAPGAASPEG